jgi:phage terminase Nu1 subunit (DNA packaging protein)
MIGVTAKSVAGLAVKDIAVRARRGRYWRDASILAYCASLRSAASGRGSPAELERVGLIRAQRVAAERKNAAGQGELLSASVVEARWASRWRELSASVLSAPTLLAQSGSLSPQETKAIDRMLRDKLLEFVERHSDDGKPKGQSDERQAA